MLNPVSDCETWEKTPVCITSCLSQDEKDFFDREKVSRSYKKGQYIYREGFSASDFVMIYKGVVKITRQKNGGEECLLDFRKENDLIGLESINDNNRYESSAIAFTDVTIYIIKRDVIIHLIQQNNDACRFLFQSFVSSISCLLRRIKDLSEGLAQVKLGRALMMLYNYIPESREKGLTIKRDELAEISGISRETVSRGLTILKERKIISIVNRHIMLLDEKRIDKLVHSKSGKQ
jgi:CRP-like cAMP-binding protein